MGRNLFIRVSTATYNEDAVFKDWPRLCALVRPDNPFPVLPKDTGPFGVVELLRELADNGAFLPKGPAAEALAPFLPKLARLRQMMDDALGDRDVKKAHALTDEIEDALDEAEKSLP